MNETPLTDEELVAMSKALGHPARLRIVRRLLEIDRCVCGEIVDMFPLAQSTVSQHLKALKDAGLLRGEVEGPRTCYCVDKERLARFKAAVAAL
jgi:ArsR family transcriptional regulator